MSDDSTIAMPASLLERFAGVLERIETRLAMPVAPGDELLTKAAVAARIGKSIRDVERLMKRGKLKKVPDLGKRTARFRPVDVERLLADKDEQPGRRRL